MYNRQDDFIHFDNSGKRYFGMPSQEVNFYFDYEADAWYYEFIDRNSLNLSDLDEQGIGFYLNRSLNDNDHIFIQNLLESRFPDAIVNAYECAEHLLADKDADCYR